MKDPSATPQITRSCAVAVSDVGGLNGDALLQMSYKMREEQDFAGDPTWQNGRTCRLRRLRALGSRHRHFPSLSSPCLAVWQLRGHGRARRDRGEIRGRGGEREREPIESRNIVWKRWSQVSDAVMSPASVLFSPFPASKSFVLFPSFLPSCAIIGRRPEQHRGRGTGRDRDEGAGDSGSTPGDPDIDSVVLELPGV